MTHRPLGGRAMTRRSWLASGLMVATAAVAEGLTPRRFMALEAPLPTLPELFPMQVGAWIGSPAQPRMLITPDVQAVLDALYQQTLARLYDHPRLGQVMLAVAYGGDQSDATRAHRPEVCYPAQGFTVSGVHRDELSLMPHGSLHRLPVRRMVARLGPRHEPVTYWINTGGTVATDGLEQKLAQMRHGLRGIVPDGMLMRVSSLDRDPERAWRVQTHFAQSLYQTMPPAWRHRVFGPGGAA